VLLAVPLAAAVSAPTVRSPCNDWLPGTFVIDTSCGGPIHPGARMQNGCTLNWVVTDGVDLYVGTAGHCASFAAPDLYVAGVDGSVGTLAYRGQDVGGNDTAYFRIAPSAWSLVDPTLQQWGGPASGPSAPDHGSPVPGQPLVTYGWGVATAGTPELRGRLGVTAYAWPTDHNVYFVSEGVSGGDSGSPIATLDGQAVGHVVATIFPAHAVCALTPVCPPADAPVGNVVFGVNVQTEMLALGHYLNRTVTLVRGEPMVD
jgi:hypothetical protein